VVVNHGVEPALRDALRTVGAFHAADAATKLPLAAKGLYDPPGQVRIAVRPSTLHERLNYPRVTYDDDLAVLGADGPARAGPPVTGYARGSAVDNGCGPIGERDAPLFTASSTEGCEDSWGVDRAMRAYQRGLRRLALALVRTMAVALELPATHFDHGWARSNSGVTSLHYLPLSSEDDAPRTDGFAGRTEFVAAAGPDDQGQTPPPPPPKDEEDAAPTKTTSSGEDAPVTAVGKSTSPKKTNDGDGIGDLGASLRAYPHADGDTMLTLLAHDRVDGLQVLMRGATTAEDAWLDVPRVAEDQVVVQIGQMTQRWTNDAYLATPHRVLRPAAPAPARTTLSMFFRPGLETALEVPPSLRAKLNDAGAVYDTVSVEQFLRLPRTDAVGNAVKLTSNVLKDGRWVGARPGACVVPSVA